MQVMDLNGDYVALARSAEIDRNSRRDPIEFQKES